MNIEEGDPIVKYHGLKTAKDVEFTGSVILPAGTTIGGSTVVALGDITSSSTTVNAFAVTNTGVFTGASVVSFIANSATTGVIFLGTANGLTTGRLVSLSSSGVIVTTGDMVTIVANSATTSTGLVRVSGTGLTDGFLLSLTGGGANYTSSGGGINLALGAATVGTGIKVVSTGVYTGTTGLLAITGNSATSGSISVISATGATSGKVLVLNATEATLTTGRYLSANDATLEVFGIGANGHIHTAQTTAPTIAVTNQAGITAAALTAGASDTCGIITTTGTSTGATVLDVTFHKTYTTAPKAVILVPANAAAGMPNTGYIVSAVSATTFTITVAALATYAATPSWRYFVIA